MRSTDRHARPWSFAVCALAFAASAARAQEQPQATGFAVERFLPAAPGSRWLSAEDLGWQPGLSGGVSLAVTYAHGPLRLDTPGGSLAVVEHQSSASLGLAVSYDRFRLRTTFSNPLYVAGQSGVAGGVAFTAPALNLEQTPDLITDVQATLDVRLFGDARSPLRAGVSATLFVPSGDRADYTTDGTYRAAGVVRVAGDAGAFAYAGHAGVHLRPLDEPQVPGSPRGSELLFGASFGVRAAAASGTLFLGDEIFAATAFKALFGAQTTELETLLSVSFDHPSLASGRLRFKLGAGRGLTSHFGAPDARVVFGAELIGHAGSPTQGTQ